MIMVDEVVNNTITDLHTSNEEQATTPQTTGGATRSRRLEQRRIQVEVLVAVLLIEDSDRKE